MSCVEPTTSVLGGYMRDRKTAKLPRWFSLSHGQKRCVNVRVMKYYGVGVHYHVQVIEEDDAFYVVLPKRLSKRDRQRYKPGQTFLWRPFDLPREMRGRSANAKFNTFGPAPRYVERVLKVWGATDVTHEVAWEDFTDSMRATGRWFYREGD